MTSLARIATALEQLLATAEQIVKHQQDIERQQQEQQQAFDSALKAFTDVTSNHQLMNKWMADHQAHCETWHARTFAAVATTGKH